MFFIIFEKNVFFYSLSIIILVNVSERRFFNLSYTIFMKIYENIQHPIWTFMMKFLFYDIQYLSIYKCTAI